MVIRILCRIVIFKGREESTKWCGSTSTARKMTKWSPLYTFLNSSSIHMGNASESDDKSTLRERQKWEKEKQGLKMATDDFIFTRKLNDYDGLSTKGVEWSRLALNKSPLLSYFQLI